MSDKLDIQDVLAHIDRGDYEFFDNLTDEQVKGLSPYVILMWMSGTRSKLQLKLLNRMLNPYAFNLGQHPRLLYKLAIASSDGKATKYSFKPRKKRYKSKSTTVKVITAYYGCSVKDANDYIELLDCDAVIALAEELGEQDDVMKKIKAEFK